MPIGDDNTIFETCSARRLRRAITGLRRYFVERPLTTDRGVNFIYNLTTSKEKNITNGAVAMDKEVSTRYPLSKLTALGDTFGWSATVTVEGADVHRCPGGEAKTQFPAG